MYFENTFWCDNLLNISRMGGYIIIKRECVYNDLWVYWKQSLKPSSLHIENIEYRKTYIMKSLIL